LEDKSLEEAIEYLGFGIKEVRGDMNREELNFIKGLQNVE
jgi:hypothetical protein